VVALPSRSAPPAVGSGDLVADAAGGPGDQDAVAGLEVGGVDRGDGGDSGEPGCGALDEVDRLGQRGQADGCGPSTRPPNVKMASVPAGQGYVVGLQDLTWDLILISALQPACSPGSPPRPADERTAGDRCVPVGRHTPTLCVFKPHRGRWLAGRHGRPDLFLIRHIRGMHSGRWCGDSQLMRMARPMRAMSSKLGRRFQPSARQPALGGHCHGWQALLTAGPLLRF
jgi:hypothetical protein